MESTNLQQAIDKFILTFYDVRRLFNLIDDLPILKREGVFTNDYLINGNLTYKDIAILKNKLIHDATLVGDIESGIIGKPDDNDSIVCNRLNYVTYKINTSYLFKIENPVDLILQKKKYLFECLSPIIGGKDASSYINCLMYIFKDWNLLLDLLMNIIANIKNERLGDVSMEDIPEDTPEENPSINPSSQAKNLPRELDTPEIRAVLDKAIKIGLLEDYYTLKGAKMLLACLCWGICKEYDLGTIAKNGENKGGFAANWILFWSIFWNIFHRYIAQSFILNVSNYIH